MSWQWRPLTAIFFCSHSPHTMTLLATAQAPTIHTQSKSYFSSITQCLSVTIFKNRKLLAKNGHFQWATNTLNFNELTENNHFWRHFKASVSCTSCSSLSQWTSRRMYRPFFFWAGLAVQLALLCCSSRSS